MPIRCALKLRPICDAEFDAIDRVVMGCAFASQNTLGRLCDEHVYENDVAALLRAAGFRDVVTQEPIFVTWLDFTKRYRLDLVVNQMLYELKTVSALSGEHDAQAIHYGTLLNIDRVKLLNFRPHKVVGKLKRCPVMGQERFRVTIDDASWRLLSERCEWLANLANDLFHDWGAFLDTELYEDALMHFCGGKEFCQRRVCVMRDGIELGTHRLAFHSDNIPFVITSFTSDLSIHELHLRRLLHHTSLPGLQWLNFNHLTLELRTVASD
jgi:GxxExxY protein